MNNDKLKFLSNKPLGKDLFEGQSQDNIANVISKNIEENDSNHKMIGIEGGWGVGKSNVIELIQRKLDNSKYKFFIYDVWGHQDDLQRKSILQELIQFLTVENKILKRKGDWDNKVKELTGTRIETKKTTTPKLSFGICVTFFLFVLLPVFESWAETKTCLKEKIPILCIPIFVIMGLYVIYFIKALFSVKKRGKRTIAEYLFADSFAKIINIYNDKEIESSDTEFTHESNPSVVDFNNFMSDLSKGIKESSADTKLIIIFDNMDRLPVDNVKSLWSSIHTFYSEKKYPNIVTIVTFDREHIKSAFKDDGDDKIGNDYINKTFDIVYRVAQPILTDWKLFLKKMWEEAFKDENTLTEYSKVEQVYDFLGEKESFTPRQIITFINEIVSIKLILKYNIPERYIAIFILKKDLLLKNSLKAIIDKEYLGELSTIYQNDEMLDEYIAALIYQIDPERALAVVYVNELKQALDKNLTTKLDLFKKASFLSLIMDDALKEISNYKNTVLALDYLKDSIPQIENEKFWDYIYQRIIIDTKNQQNNEGLESYQKILIKHCDYEKTRNYAKYLINIYFSENPISPIGMYRVIKNFFDLGVEKDYLLSIQNETKLNPEIYENLLTEAKENINLTKFVCPIEELDKYYSSLELSKIQSLESTKWIKESYNLNSFRGVLEKYLINNRGNYPVFFDILTQLKVISKNTVDLSKLPKDTWDGLFQKATAVQKMELLAIGLLKSYLPPVFVNQLTSQTPSEEDIINFAQVIEYYYTFDNILINLKAFKKYPIYLSACKKLILNEVDGKNVADIHLLLENFKSIQLNTQISPDILFNKFSRWEFKDSCKTKECLNLDVLQMAIGKNNVFSKKCISNANKLLSDFTNDNWIDAFKNTNTYGVKEAVLINFDWNSQSLEALRSVLIDIASDRIPVPTDNKPFIDVASQIRIGNSIFKDVRDEFCKSGAKMSKGKFLFFADMLFKYGKLEDDVNSLRKIIPIALLNDAEINEIINKYSEIFIKLLNNAGEEAEEYKQKIISDVSTNNDGYLKVLFDKLHLSLPRDESNEE